MGFGSNLIWFLNKNIFFNKMLFNLCFQNITTECLISVDIISWNRTKKENITWRTFCSLILEEKKVIVEVDYISTLMSLYSREQRYFFCEFYVYIASVYNTYLSWHITKELLEIGKSYWRHETFIESTKF